MKFSVIFLLLTIGLTAVLSQTDSRELEESGTPKKVLRRYRVRRPVILDANGNKVSPTIVTTPGAKLRRIRIKNPTPTPGTLVAVTSTSKPVVATPEALLQARYAGLQSTQQIVEPQIVEPIRVVPQYRTATTSEARSALLKSVNLRERNDENKKPNVGTTRNYSYVNEDGSFTFGYEAEDGSFKEETRGIDCVARGKYGYVDPDGVRREFSYVSGNPCDPNAPKDDTTEETDEESTPQLSAGIRALTRRPISEVSQGLEQTLEERVPENQLPQLFTVARRQRVRPQVQTLVPVSAPVEATTLRPFNTIQPTTFRPRFRFTTQAPSALTTTESGIPEYILRAFPQFRQPTIAPEPVSQSLEEVRPAGQAVDFDQELQRIAGRVQLQQQQPAFAQQQQQGFVQHHPIHTFPTRQIFGGRTANAIFENMPQPQPQFLQARRAGPVVPPAPQAQRQQVQQQQTTQDKNYGSYRTELVYDPASGQYTSVLVQDIPRANEEITLTQTLRAFADPTPAPTPQPDFQFFGNFGNFGQQQQQQQRQQPFQYFQAPQQYLQETQVQQPQAQQQQQFQRQPLFAAPTQNTIEYSGPPQQYSNNFVTSPSSSYSPLGQIEAFLRSLGRG